MTRLIVLAALLSSGCAYIMEQRHPSQGQTVEDFCAGEALMAWSPGTESAGGSMSWRPSRRSFGYWYRDCLSTECTKPGAKCASVEGEP